MLLLASDLDVRLYAVARLLRCALYLAFFYLDYFFLFDMRRCSAGGRNRRILPISHGEMVRLAGLWFFGDFFAFLWCCFYPDYFC